MALEMADERVGQAMKSDQVAEIVKGPEIPINKAVLLSNLMIHCGASESERALALEAGKEALKIIDDYELFYAPGADGRKAAAMRGYLTGSIRRLEGKPPDYAYLIPSAAAYMTGALLGAWLGTYVHFGYNTTTTKTFPVRFPDARAFLGPLFAFFLIVPFTKMLVSWVSRVQFSWVFSVQEELPSCTLIWVCHNLHWRRLDYSLFHIFSGTSELIGDGYELLDSHYFLNSIVAIANCQLFYFATIFNTRPPLISTT
jgi:hypothetical protein